MHQALKTKNNGNVWILQEYSFSPLKWVSCFILVIPEIHVFYGEKYWKKITPKFWICSLHRYQISQNTDGGISCQCHEGDEACVKVILRESRSDLEKLHSEAPLGEAAGWVLQQSGKSLPHRVLQRSQKILVKTQMCPFLSPHQQD